MIRSNGEATASRAPSASDGRAPTALAQAEAALGEDRRPCLITGGAGFIGANVARRLLALGRPVMLLDNLSRPHVQRNVDELRREFGSRVELIRGDIRDEQLLPRLVRKAGHVFHFAAQVAVTTSLVDPVTDFDVNARGTLNLLEALRGCDNPPPLLFTSTNKVYGPLDDIRLNALPKRYEPSDPHLRRRGLQPASLDLYSPYGCSKGAADQYVLDYARSFDIPAIVFRMSCIYGPRQFGTEDQGWVAHFLLSAMRDEPVAIYGDGRQVRDILYIDDLVDAMLLTQASARRLAGRVFNVGGGPTRTASLLELIDLIEQLEIGGVIAAFEEWRVGDQRYYVSAVEPLTEAVGWRPRVSLREGIKRLHQWLLEHEPAAPRLQAGPDMVGGAHDHGD